MIYLDINTMIKAVIFDIDGVLMNTLAANVKFFQNLMIKNGYAPPSHEEYKKLYHLPMIDAIRQLTKSTDEKKIQRIFTMGANREVPYPIELVSSPVKMKDTIAILAKKYVLGIVTNRIKKSVFALQNMKEIEKYFQYAIALEDIKNPKPDPEGLLLICKKTHIEANEAVYIGDSKTDLQATQAIGMKFILFPKGDIEGAGISTNNFKELPKIIKNIH